MKDPQGCGIKTHLVPDIIGLLVRMARLVGDQQNAWLHILKPDGKVGFGTSDPKSNLSIDCAGSGNEGIFLQQTSGSGSIGYYKLTQ